MAMSSGGSPSEQGSEAAAVPAGALVPGSWVTDVYILAQRLWYLVLASTGICGGALLCAAIFLAGLGEQNLPAQSSRPATQPLILPSFPLIPLAPLTPPPTHPPTTTTTTTIRPLVFAYPHLLRLLPRFVRFHQARMSLCSLSSCSPLLQVPWALAVPRCCIALPRRLRTSLPRSISTTERSTPPAPKP